MAFKGLRFAGLEWKNITASKVMWVVIAAIAIMPLLYGALYLAAFQDPYARLNTVPVAVVNEDKGATIAAENRNLGDDVVDELKKTDDGLQWHFVSAEEAERGLADGEYFMTCVIPSDFSASVASVDGNAPQKAQLKVEYNESENMLASQIGETVWKEVRQRMSDTVATEYWTTVLDRVADSGKDIQKAADGADDLKDGLVTAKDGSKTITTNLGTLEDGALSLDSGLTTLSSGALTLDSGLGTLANGAGTLKDGTGSLVTGAKALKSGASQVAEGAGSVESGAKQLRQDGTSKVAAGTAQVKDGAEELASSTSAKSELGAGAAQLTDGLDQLKAGTKDLPAQTEALKDGVDTLVGTVAASVGSDSDPNSILGGTTAISQGAAGIASGVGDAQAALGTIAGGEGLGAVSGGLSTAETSLQGVADQVRAAGDTELAQTLEKIEAGIAQSRGGVDTAAGTLGAVSSGLDAAVQGAGAIEAGADTMHTQAAALSGQLSDPNGQIAQLLSGMDQLNASAGTLQEGIAQASGGASSLQGGIAQVNGGASKLAAGATETAVGASQVNGKMGELVAGSSKVASGAGQVSEGASSAVSGAKQLDDGASQLVAGTDSAKDGASQLAAGAQSAKDGSAKIADGATQLHEGSETLTTGLHDAVDGSGELAVKLSEGAETAADQTTNIPAKSDVMSDPVELVNEYYTTVKNYGTGFAPYFMALGLWVGGLVAGFVFKPLNGRLILSGANPVTTAFSNFLPWAAFALIQATLLMVVLQFGLQLQIDNVPAFYGMGYLTALVFAAIMQFLMAAFGFPGKFVAIILLMLQLTACAGTFPIQTTPDFFQIINPYMPMTYVVQGMRQIMTGLDYGIVAFDCAVLLGIGAACFALTCVVAYRKRTVRMDDLHPVLQLG